MEKNTESLNTLAADPWLGKRLSTSVSTFSLVSDFTYITVLTNKGKAVVWKYFTLNMFNEIFIAFCLRAKVNRTLPCIHERVLNLEISFGIHLWSGRSGQYILAPIICQQIIKIMQQKITWINTAESIKKLTEKKRL